MTEQLQRFIGLLRGIFELDKADLDFGIYRIMNIRKNEIEKFLNDGLPLKVQEALKPFATDTAEIEAKIKAIENQCESVGVEVAKSKMAAEYTRLKGELAGGVDLSGMEADVYSALYSFFNRYYEEGDFISKRRYKEGVYAIPYEGEEVKLYWANQDQYYIKTSENFKDYTFVADEYTVHFRLVDATTEQNNNKEAANAKRVFMLYAETDEAPEIKTFEFDAEKKEVIIRFVFDVPADKKFNYAADNAKKIQDWIISSAKPLMLPLLAPVSKDPKKPQSLIEKHLSSYVAKNTFDYFIHKDLRGFLSRELDFYIKNEVIHIDDIDTADEKRADKWLAKVRAIKRVGKVLIEFLAQIEDFQKKLWLKKKFVIQCDWCITLDRVPEKFYAEIAQNEAQREEWVKVVAIDIIKAGTIDTGTLKLHSNHTPYSQPLSVAFIKENQFLLVDTKFFSSDFKERLLSEFDDLDAQCNGLLIHSENFQALNFMQQRYREQVKCIHIDPPYNTDTSGFLYKNNYRHSSWLSMMNERIRTAIPFMQADASFICHIDENEYENLWNLFHATPLINLSTVIWDKRNPMTGGNGIAIQHEYITWFSRSPITISMNNDNASIIIEHAASLIKKYGGVSDQVRKEFSSWLNANDSFSGGEKAYRYISDDGRIYQSVSLRAPEPRTDEKFHRPLLHPITGKPCPVPPNGFSRTPETLAMMVENDEISFGDDETTQPRQKMFLSVSKQKQLTTVIADAVKGTTDLSKMGLAFPYCHAVPFYTTILSAASDKDDDIILDFFGGSGTSGDAVITLNREKQSSKKYILVEMGDHFDNVLKPRLQKTIYAQNWKDGVPQLISPKIIKQNAPIVNEDELHFEITAVPPAIKTNPNFDHENKFNGMSQIIKYMVLESYEDALSNISLLPEAKSKNMLELFGEEYLIEYMLDFESKGSVLNLAAFKDPFDYELKVTEKNATVLKKVDLLETFNYLLGLTVEKVYARRIFRATPDADGEYAGAVKLSLDVNGNYLFRQVEGKLPDGRRALIIWRNITDNTLESNAALDAYFTRYRINPLDREYDVIYVNGDNNIENLRSDAENWKVRLIETEFKNRMFEEV